MNEINPLKLKPVDLETVNDVNKSPGLYFVSSLSVWKIFKTNTQPPEKNKVKDSGMPE